MVSVWGEPFGTVLTMRFTWLELSAATMIAAGLGLGFWTLQSFNAFEKVDSRFEGSCAPVIGVEGPEDIQVAPALARAFISSLDRRSTSGRGSILAVSIDDPLDSENWRDRTSGVPKDFRPLGVHYFEEGDTKRLFVVNDATKSVEIFEVADNGDLDHVRTVSEQRLTSPNDVVAVGPESFYVSNDVAPGRTTLLGMAQFLLRTPSGSIFYFDGVAMRVAADGLRYANGVAVSADGRRFYAAETAGQALRLYDRDPASGVLTLSRVEAMPGALDNINVAWDGALWIGAHPKPLDAARAQRAEGKTAPSMVIRYVDNPDVASPLTEVLTDNGATISTASVAAIAGSRLLIGALADNKYLICDLPG
jgi:arylesterase/paraoxonase